ncbi:unnamed protein product [Dovyalis caffra]|uniref:Uncharacterized protein n=1 Tax=Dovyalis caffra TaxID=77055 RepID=A0AAV1QNV5_9ROSI|nr:unnamed protein product [Dovyalis caffra]
MAKNWAFIFQMRMSTPGMPIDISTKFRVSSNFDFLTSKALNHFQGALLGGACEDCHFKDDQSGFDRYRHSRQRLFHINGKGPI